MGTINPGIMKKALIEKVLIGTDMDTMDLIVKAITEKAIIVKAEI